MKKAFLGVLLLAFGTLQLFAGDLSGSWSLKTKVGGHEFSLLMALKQEGDALSGSVSGPRREYAIQKGSVDSANHIEIVLGGDGPLGGAKITGTADGDRLRLTVQTEQGQSEGIAVRSR